MTQQSQKNPFLKYVNFKGSGCDNNKKYTFSSFNKKDALSGKRLKLCSNQPAIQISEAKDLCHQ